ncbi:MAG: tetratricopeptide repeat protein [Xanthomonadales bacterium]|nr:tetratricopeptide repeat protein [Xanthomonadales bacterium]
MTEQGAGRRLATLPALLLAALLAACTTTPAPAPVEERDVPRTDPPPVTQAPPPPAPDAGVQVYPLQNPAVAQLTQEARAAEQAGRLDDAAVLLERALRIQPRDPEVLQRMAEVQLQKRDWDQALSFAVRSYDTGPRVGELCVRNWRTIGEARSQLGDASGAADAERRAAQCPATRPQGL